jgi:hypothetical protein
MIDSITFNTAEARLIIAYGDGTSKEYTEATSNQYLLEHPDRAADIAAMGWGE